MSERMRLRSFYFEDSTYERLREIAKNSDYNISDHVREAVRQYIEITDINRMAGVVEASVQPVESSGFPIELSPTPVFAGDP